MEGSVSMGRGGRRDGRGGTLLVGRDGILEIICQIFGIGLLDEWLYPLPYSL